MNEPFDTPQQLAAKIEWEGGLEETIFSYGISACDLPAGTPVKVREAWERVDAVAPDLGIIEDWLESIPEEEELWTLLLSLISSDSLVLI